MSTGTYSRRAVSLAEMLLFTGLSVVVGAMVIELYIRGTGMTDSTQKAILVQQDIRAIVEYLSRDMNAAYWVLDKGAGEREHGIMLVKYASANTTERLKENMLGSDNRYDYPFFRSDEAAANRLDAQLITYEYDENEETVSRKEEKGIFITSTSSDAIGYAVDYSFEVDEVLSDRVLGKNVKQFDIDYFGYERSTDTADLPGLLKRVWDLEMVADMSDPVKIGMTACILLKIRARYEEGVYSENYANKRGYRSPETELVTKIWSMPRLRDEMYHEYFSSVDWNLLY